METAHTFLQPGGPAWVLPMKSNLIKAGSIPNPVHRRHVETLLLAEEKPQVREDAYEIAGSLFFCFFW